MKKLEKENVEDIIALSHIQEGIFFHYLNDVDSKTYFEQLLFNLNGNLDISIFEKAWIHVISTNEMLRTVFRWEKLDEPVQIILKKHNVSIEYYDLSKENSYEKQKTTNILKSNELNRINLDSEPFRITLWKYDCNKFIMAVNYHHILFDGWSLGKILNEFLSAYKYLHKDLQPITENKTKYKEFIKYCLMQDKNRQKEYWTKYLKGFKTVTRLPYDKTKENKSLKTREYVQTVPMDIKEKIYSFAKQNNITIATLIYTVWSVLLQKYNNINDVVFGTTISGRPTDIKGIDNMVGLFINTLPLRIEYNNDIRGFELLNLCDKLLIERKEFELTPLVEIKEYSDLYKEEPLFDSIVVIENYPIDNILDGNNDSKLEIQLDSVVESTNYNLTIIIQTFNVLEIRFLYNETAFITSTIERLSEHFMNIAQNIISNPELKVSEIEMLSEEEKREILIKSKNIIEEGEYDFD